MISDDPEPQSSADAVLIVEDNEANTLLALRQLRLLGYPATAVRNGREALDAVGKSPFALILMDCQMPEMDGFETTRSIRKREASETSEAGNRPRTPIIAMTANATQLDRQACLAAGMDDYISKPVTLETLQAVLDRWMPAQAGRRRRRRSTGPAAAPPRSAVLDRAVLTRLREEVGAGASSAFLNTFLSELPARSSAIRKAAEAGDAEELHRMAHTLKSTGATLGAGALAEVCAKLESAVRGGETEGVGELVAAVEAEAGRAREALERERLIGR